MFYKVNERYAVKEYPSTHDLDIKKRMSTDSIRNGRRHKMKRIQLSVLDGRLSTGS